MSVAEVVRRCVDYGLDAGKADPARLCSRAAALVGAASVPGSG